jgi:hypothetical protein
MKYEDTLPATRCTPQVKEQLQMIANAEDVSLGVVIRRAVHFFLLHSNTFRTEKDTKRIDLCKPLEN